MSEMVRVPWVKVIAWSFVGTLVSLAALFFIVGTPFVFREAFVPYENAPTANVIAADFPDWVLSDNSNRQHDGTQFYVMARSVFDMAGDGTNLDRPHYRWQRPLLSWMVAPGYWLGGPDGLIAAFFLVNVAAIFAGAVAVGVLGVRFGGSSRIALWLPILPGAYISLKLGVADVLALTLFLVGYIQMASKRTVLASTFFVLACLAKETSLVLVAGVVLWEVLDGQKLRRVVSQTRKNIKKFLILAGPAVAAILTWGVFVRLVVPLDPDAIPQIGELTYPFEGFIETVRETAQSPNRQGFVLFSWVIVLVFSGVAFWKHRFRHPFSWALLGSVVLLMVMNVSVIGLPANATRMLLAPTVLALLMAVTPKGLYGEGKESQGTESDDNLQKTTHSSS